MREVDIAIIGGGAAGMSAAVSAWEHGVRNILILERNDALGGVLHQCIHNGFGLHRFGEDLTGVEFAARCQEAVEERKIPSLLRTFVVELTADRIIKAVSPEEGFIEIRAKAVILAMGCRERSRNALLIPGSRGAGILTAGTAQKYLNIDGYLPGRRIVILGSGDIGLIMARQFALEGASVEAVVEIMPYSAGLPRNMKQCIEDFGIPVYYNSTISRIEGRERVSKVHVARVDENREVIPETEFAIECDTLLISAGLIPENELTEQAGIRMSEATRGALVTEDNQTSAAGIFSCGNVLHVHDLVDYVAEEGERTGEYAAAYVRGESVPSTQSIPLHAKAGVKALVPQRIHRPLPDQLTIMFRPEKKMIDACVKVLAGEKELCRKRCRALTPSEMCRIDLKLDEAAGEDQITVMAEEVNG